MSVMHLLAWATWTALALPALAACTERAAPVSNATGCADGLLRGALHGAVAAEIDWRGADLSCEGMPRPDNEGARLRFAGMLSTDDGRRPLAFIIALPELERGRTVVETPARVTLIEESDGRFFSSGDAEVCWSDITRHRPLDDERYEIRGIVYCMSPLAAVNGPGGVAFTELDFAGRVDWSGPR